MTPTILLPGLLNDAALWQRQIEDLRTEAAIQVPDISAQDNIAALAAHVLTGAPDRFALGGLSMGGYVAMEIMRQAPERVTRLALFDTTARPDTPEQTEKRRALIALSRSGKFKGVTPRLLPLVVNEKHLHDARVTQPIFEMAERMGREAFERQQTAIMGRIDSRESLKTISCPTLIAVGADDQITPPPLAEEMAALIPGARLEVVQDCGHLMPLEQPGRATGLLRAWLHL